ncbi:MAG TPA: Uma2 family endonuclease [Pyrinomonadaceae bacterium]|nr:Uma2 family endonuclease [Pyrinomonadaceae bacterium]
MAATLISTERKPVVLHLGPVLGRMTEHEFYEFCQLNKDLRIELNSKGDLIIMPPTGGKTGRRSSKLTARLTVWAEDDGTGQPFDSSTGFTLPNGAKRSPDFAWVANERWNAFTEEEQEEFPPLCPDFVVELRSRTDSLALLQKKMKEYIENGIRLGWLIDPVKKKVYVYRPQAAVEILDDPETISGEPLLHGFALDVRALWN